MIQCVGAGAGDGGDEGVAGKCVYRVDSIFDVDESVQLLLLEALEILIQVINNRTFAVKVLVIQFVIRKLCFFTKQN